MTTSDFSQRLVSVIHLLSQNQGASMSLNISGTFNRTISDARIEHVQQAQSKQQATYMGPWDKIKDWFCGTDKAQALSFLYDVTHGNDVNTSESASKKMEAFCKLGQLAGSRYENQFKGDVQDNQNGTFSFDYEIVGALDKTSVHYGDPAQEAVQILARDLTNGSQYLIGDNVTSHGVKGALEKVSYNQQTRTYQGITSANQGRLATELLSTQAKEKMGRDRGLAQQWVAIQMKSFDHFSDQRSRLEQIEGAGLMDVVNTPREWLYHGATSISKVRDNANHHFARQQEPVAIRPSAIQRTESKPQPDTQVSRLLPGLVQPPRNDAQWNFGRDQEGEKRYRDITHLIHALDALKTHQNTHCEFQTDANYQYQPQTGGVQSDYHRAGEITRASLFQEAKNAGYDLKDSKIHAQVSNIVGLYHSLNYESLLTTTGTLLR
ncbi:hypothetical protein [Vibrio ostreicida]|uniref:hypothetical protein n=1 Tax=Vibrio ostreicida TaxID=526588 RepID=UPI000A0053F7|nr:hypothetical protein [Vibrio ostreicida]